jgi:hypothetical protein
MRGLDSGLQELLRRRGYDVRPAGTAECLSPMTETVTELGATRKVTRQHVSPQLVETYEFKLTDG